MMSALPLAPSRLSKLWILYLNDLVDGDLARLCKNLFYFRIYFFLFSGFQTFYQMR